MIESYSFGEIIIDGQRFTNDVIIFPNRVMGNWWRDEGHSLQPQDIDEIVEEGPEVLVVGTGASGLMSVPEETRDYVESKGIELIVEDTESACKTFNDLEDSREAVAALHLTC